ncbi:MAG: isoprenylcysteine carboxylmethyltransferase family protein [Candidatus Hydrogenedentota bacterium]
MDVELVFRLVFIGVFLGSISISIFYRRRARADSGTIARREEGAGIVLLRLFFALPLFLSIFAYMINPELLAWSVVSVPVEVRWVGVGFGLACVPLLWWVFSSIGSNISETVLTKAEHELVTHGPYRWVRHPLYSVATLMFISCAVIASSWWILLFAVVALVMIAVVVIPREEEALVAKFGEAYEAYRLRAGRLFPRIGSPASQ